VRELNIIMGKSGTGKRMTPMTREEEADEIIKRLSTPPRKNRTLTATWTVESLKDLTTSHGIDIEQEIMDALSASIAEEIDRELIEDAKRKSRT